MRATLNVRYQDGGVDALEREAVALPAPIAPIAPIAPKPSPPQRRWLTRGLRQPGSKLPLFDEDGQLINRRTVAACIKAGWAEPWQRNPIKPDWLVCKLTADGRAVLGRMQ